MKHSLALACAAAAALSSLSQAQSNAIPGHDIEVFTAESNTYYGRTGPAYPNGTAGFMIGHSMGNCGTNHIPWDGVVGGVMQDQHIKIAFIIARLDSGNGRMVQVSGKSYCKHSRVAYNLGSTSCGTCQSGPSNHFRINCFDAYTTGWNGDRNNLGPTTEINPWTGEWNPTGSYFDIGDPSQPGYPYPADNIQSLSTSGFSPLKNRINCAEQELAQPGLFYAQDHVVIIGEPVGNRSNNMVSRRTNISWTGGGWTNQFTGSNLQGSVLNRWPGASLSMAGNGTDDGRFLVGVKVTGPVNGLWHYEYAIHNVDNHRGGGAFRLPMCSEATVSGVGFHDIDSNSGNDWTMTRGGDYLEFQAGVNNPHDWNTIYNVWFDCDVPPTSGAFEVDAARSGPGAFTTSIPTTVPGFTGHVDLGPGCALGTVPSLSGNSHPSAGNGGYAIDCTLDPGAIGVLGFALDSAAGNIGPGCTLYLDLNQLVATEVVLGSAGGTATFPLPLTTVLSPADLVVQMGTLQTGAPGLGFLNMSNGLLIRAAATTCP